MLPFRDMTEPELTAFFANLGSDIASQLPEGAQYFLLVTEQSFGQAPGHYQTNMQRLQAVSNLRQMAEALEKWDIIQRGDSECT